MDFTPPLLRWYRANRRDLPWRRTKDPYLVWLSEVILQQTRVEQGLPYYEKFVKAYPTIRHLAAADEQEVLTRWQGLGYYSRARNLLVAARAVVNECNGEFPRTYDQIRRLKGVGDYTAAAIVSICFGSPHPVIDGNVLRFFSRVFGITGPIELSATKNAIRAKAMELIDRSRPGDFNQAVMEFGATVCTPANPRCTGCIFSSMCQALKHGMVANLPARKPGGRVRDRYIHYLVVTYTHRGEDYIFLNKRTGNDIWKNLYDVPSIELPPEEKDRILAPGDFSVLLNQAPPGFLEVSCLYVHLLTHRKIHARFYRFHSDKPVELPCLVVLLKDIHRYPFPRLIERYMAQALLKPE
jgi:A/G-specific adenine glycosylase